MGDGKGPSGELRFSIEDLLYYAPRFIDAGDMLWAAADSTQKRLEGLGAFRGGSSPDKAFAAGYEPAQYATLIIVKKLAVELKGIGAGVQQMAREYSISEADIQHDIRRINDAVVHESSLLRHTGGLEGPPPAPQLPSSRPAPPSTPSPTPQPLPTPRAQRPHSPSPHPTPSPSPLPSPDPAAWKWGNRTTFLGPWPTGDPGRMDEAASAWKDLSSAVDTAWRDTQKYTAYVMSDNHGAAADAFHETVEGLIDPQSGGMTHALQTCEQLQAACTKQAQAVRDLQHEFENLAAQLVASFVIDLALAYFTFGATEAAEAAIAAGIEARTVYLATRFAVFGEELAEIIGESVGKMVAKGATAGGTSLASATIGLPVNNAIAKAFGQDQVGGTQALHQILAGLMRSHMVRPTR
jgi:hypothetical protein